MHGHSPWRRANVSSLPPTTARATRCAMPRRSNAVWAFRVAIGMMPTCLLSCGTPDPESPSQVVSLPAPDVAPSNSALTGQVPPAGECRVYRVECPSTASLNSDRTPKCFPEAPALDVGHAVVFAIDDFGPPSLQKGLVGNAWWAWESGGSFAPTDSFDIRVVVSQGRSKQDLAKAYPTLEGKSDYRFLSRERALKYLDGALAELAIPEAQSDLKEGENPFDFQPLMEQLRATRSNILSCLPDGVR
jgi:hypothetical protein